MLVISTHEGNIMLHPIGKLVLSEDVCIFDVMYLRLE